MIPKWWNVVIALSAFLIQVITFGIAETISLYNIEFLEYFDVDVAAVSLVGSINLGVFLGSGPFVSLLMRHIRHRTVAIIGSLLSTISLLCIPFVDSIIYMYILYGVLAGLGFGMAFLPSSVLTGLYFDKHRSLASGFVNSGLGLGIVIFPLFAHNIIDFYGWKGSRIILAGVMFQCVAFSALLFSLEKDNKSIKQEMDYVLVESANGHLPDVDEHQVQCSKNVDAGLNENETNKTKTKAAKNTSEETTDNQTLKHCYVLSDFSFFIFFVNNILWNMGTAITMVLQADYYYNMGLTKEDAAIIITCSGVGCFFGSILGGALCNIKCLNRFYVYIAFNIMAGSFTLIVTLKIVQTAEILSCIMLLYGLAFGGILGLLVIFTVDLLGEKALGDGMGYLMLSNGVGAIAGPPIGGAIKDSVGTYDHTYYFSGTLIVIAGLVMLLIPTKNWFKSKTKLQGAKGHA